MKMRLFLIGVGACLALAVGVLLPRVGGDGDRFSVALALLAEGRGDQAALLFDDPVWRGVAEYQAGRYQRAADVFGQSEDAVSLYNLGNAQAKLGAWSDARNAYLSVLRIEPEHEDALHNLELVTAAQKLEAELAEADRKVRQADDESNATDTINKKGETATEETVDDGSHQSAEGVQATDDTSQSSGQANRPGRAAERDGAESATGATATLFGGEKRAETTADGTGAATILRDSTQAAEILLRRIKDDPARVLRARLRAAHQARKEEASQ